MRCSELFDLPAAELVRGQVDVIVAGSPALLAIGDDVIE